MVGDQRGLVEFCSCDDKTVPGLGECCFWGRYRMGQFGQDEVLSPVVGEGEGFWYAVVRRGGVGISPSFSVAVPYSLRSEEVPYVLVQPVAVSELPVL